MCLDVVEESNRESLCVTKTPLRLQRSPPVNAKSLDSFDEALQQHYYVLDHVLFLAGALQHDRELWHTFCPHGVPDVSGIIFTPKPSPSAHARSLQNTRELAASLVLMARSDLNFTWQAWDGTCRGSWLSLIHPTLSEVL